MSLSPRTVYAIACDGPGCPVTFGIGERDDFSELQMEAPSDADGWAGVLREHGWAVTHRHLCPACVRRQAEQLTGGVR